MHALAARTVAIYPGKGDGSFLPRRDVKAGLHPYRVAVADFDRDGILDPEHIAENYWMLHKQPRDAWTFEIDVRPWIEKW